MGVESTPSSSGDRNRFSRIARLHFNMAAEYFLCHGRSDHIGWGQIAVMHDRFQWCNEFVYRFLIARTKKRGFSRCYWVLSQKQTVIKVSVVPLCRRSSDLTCACSFGHRWNESVFWLEGKWKEFTGIAPVVQLTTESNGINFFSCLACLTSLLWSPYCFHRRQR